MTKNIRLLLFVAVPVVILGALAAANTPLLKKWRTTRPKAADEQTGDKKDPVQQALMKELMGWLHPFDTTNSSFYLNGLLTAIDRTDSANAMIDIPYSVCKYGHRFFLRIGHTETFNTSACYLHVDHAAQKMILGKPREVMHPSGLPTGDLYEYIRSEGYAFTKSRTDNRLYTISMQNPYHVSQKEMTVQYDSIAVQVKKIFIRQAEVTDPMNADKEKWITLVIKDWNDDPDELQYLNLQKFIQKKQDHWACTPAYEHYELIVQ